MSKIKLTGHASGTGVLTVTAPNTSTDRTITLPDTTGTLLDENSSLPAANLTGTVADARISALTASKLTGNLPAINGSALTNLPSASPSTGDVVQVKTFSSTGGSNDNTNVTWRDTHLVTTITPQYNNSQIVLISRMNVYQNNTSGECSLALDFRRSISGGSTNNNISGSTSTSTAAHWSIGNGERTIIFNHHAIDTPNTTSEVTYALRLNSQGTANTIWGWQDVPDTLVIMEVKV